MGHERVDPNLAARANQSAHQRLAEMLAIERKGNVRATYCVVGCFLDEVRAQIEAGGHCLAFHTYDHRVNRFWPLPKARDTVLRLLSHGRGPAGSDQLARVREVDYRIKGYRPSQSKITRELSDRRLCFHNFEWLASSAHSLGSQVPGLKNRIVKIPILLDDFDMYARGLPYEQWERRALQLVRENDFVALSLHDCYADFWLPHYEGFLAKLGALGRFKTMDELASETFFAAAS
jgi:peptidoglycan/xylan/chitin deacetylase (PgdA/CDA1 family)